MQDNLEGKGFRSRDSSLQVRIKSGEEEWG